MDGRSVEEEDGGAESERFFEQDRRHGEELRQWQAQERAIRLQSLCAPVCDALWHGARPASRLTG